MSSGTDITGGSWQVGRERGGGMCPRPQQVPLDSPVTAPLPHDLLTSLPACHSPGPYARGHSQVLGSR